MFEKWIQNLRERTTIRNGAVSNVPIGTALDAGFLLAPSSVRDLPGELSRIGLDFLGVNLYPEGLGSSYASSQFAIHSVAAVMANIRTVYSGIKIVVTEVRKEYFWNIRLISNQ